jgi:hypothetical protein
MDVFFERVISNMCSLVAVMADCSILQQMCNIFWKRTKSMHFATT